MPTNTFCCIFYLSLFVFVSGYTCNENGLYQALSAGGSVSLECSVPTVINVTSRTYNNIFDFDGKNLVTLNGNAQINVPAGGTFRNLKLVNPRIYFEGLSGANLTILDSYITTSNPYTCMKTFVSNMANTH